MESYILIAAMAAGIIILYLLEYRVRKMRGMIRGIVYIFHIGIFFELFYIGADLEYVLLFLLISLFLMLCRKGELSNGI